MTEWRVIPSYPAYEASDAGEIRRSGRIRKPWKNNKGYLCLRVYVGGLAIGTSVNWLVCEAFHGGSPSKAHEAAHWDNDPQHNVPGNLRWATAKENQQDRLRHGTDSRGERNGQAKLTIADVAAIRSALRSGLSYSAVAAQFSISKPTIAKINTGRAWSWVV